MPIYHQEKGNTFRVPPPDSHRIHSALLPTGGKWGQAVNQCRVPLPSSYVKSFMGLRENTASISTPSRNRKHGRVFHHGSTKGEWVTASFRSGRRVMDAVLTTKTNHWRLAGPVDEDVCCQAILEAKPCRPCVSLALINWPVQWYIDRYWAMQLTLLKIIWLVRQ